MRCIRQVGSASLAVLFAAGPSFGATATPQGQPGSSASVAVNHEPVACFIAGEFPQLDAGVQPINQFAKGRLYFKSALSPEYYYVDVAPMVGGVAGRLPRPKLEASPITYYFQIVGKDYRESRTGDNSAIVVKKAEDCQGRKVAAIVPTGPAAVFGAGGLAVVPAGFAAGVALAGGAAGGILGASTTTALIVGGAIAAAGVVIVVATTGGEPTPPASPSR